MTTDTDISNSENPEVIEGGEPLKGYELVADLMRRQDQVIVEIDALNDRIESAIKQLEEARKLEQRVGIASDDESEPSDSLSEAA